MRHSLRLSRLEIRHRRPLGRHAALYPDLAAKDLIRIKSYPVREWGEMIWAYMGPADAVPDLPALEMALLPASHRYVSKKWQDCNWVQALEGSIDTAHFTFAHLSFDKDEDEVLDIKKHFINPIARMNSDHMRDRKS